MEELINFRRNLETTVEVKEKENDSMSLRVKEFEKKFEVCWCVLERLYKAFDLVPNP